MHVDEAGGDDKPRDVDFPLRLAWKRSSDRHDSLPAHRDVGMKPGIAAPINYPAVAEKQVKVGIASGQNIGGANRGEERKQD
jgi:hypothetical protein